jgi:hypothetical protein
MEIKRLFCALALLILPGTAVYAADSDAIGPADDAYHLKYWPNSPTLAAYTEWWYFNLIDTTNNLEAVLVYTVTNPDQMGSAPAVAPMLAVVYPPGGAATVTELDPYPISDFSADYNAANVTLGANTIQVTGNNTYKLAGASLDGAVSWDLTYLRETPSFQGLDKAELGKDPWEKVSWLVYMPRAGVTGSLTVNGNTYTVSGSGYHDHNWGEWIPRDVLWNWAQYSQKGLWIDLYDFINQDNGAVRVGVNGGIVEFTKSQYKLYQTKWAYDSVNHVHYPVQMKLSADNGTEQLDMAVNADATVPLSEGLPYPKAEYLIYEQTASYLGKVVANGVTVKFSGKGFKEYTVERK